MTTIPRNHTRKIEKIKEMATTCRVFTLRDDFAGPQCDPKHAWEALREYHSAQLVDMGDGRWTVHVHDNLWYRLQSA